MEREKVTRRNREGGCGEHDAKEQAILLCQTHSRSIRTQQY